MGTPRHSAFGASLPLLPRWLLTELDPDDPDKNPAVLRQLARATGGEAFVPEELSEVVSVCESIAKDIRSQYTLGYVSNTPPQPGFRTLKVVARGTGKSKLLVRTRSGYFDKREAAK